MVRDNLEEVLEIERLSFPTPWSKDLFLRELHFECSRVFLAEADQSEAKRILGYICIWLVSKEVHILNLACHPQFRNQGVATSLLKYSLLFSFRRGMRKAFLEVRKSNISALHLYTKYGFVPLELRKGYYDDTKEDAIVMTLEMDSKLFFNAFTSHR
jgi:ribosomal-protein-alanine N-acetyltransferase